MEQLIPKLRFPEFKGEWEKKRLGDISKKIGSGKTPSGGSKVYESKGIPFIRSQNVNDNMLILDETYISDEIHKSMKSSKVFMNDILLNITGGSIGRSCVVPSNIKEANVNQHVCIIRLNEHNPHFIQKMISSYIGQKMIYQSQTGSGREGLNFNSISKFKITIPSLPEQQKIADYLSTIDRKLELLRQKKEQLECYKKGMMQQLFSQQVRFKDDNGNNYPEWSLLNGNEVFENYSNKKHNGDFPILAVTQDRGAIPREYIDYKVQVTDSSISSYKIVEKGCFIISLRTFQGGIEYSEYKGICSPAYVVLKAFIDIESFFFKYYFKTMDCIKQINSKLEGIRDGKIISYKYFSEIKLPFPSLPEQKKIADFLSALDSKIEGVGNQIGQTEAFKKAMLQQLFV